MLSGAGAVFQEQLGLPYQMGILVTLIFCYIVVLKGLNGIFAINSYIVPLMILFGLFVAASIISQHPHELIGQVLPTQLPENMSWAVSPFAYAAFNLMTAQVVLVPLGKEIRDEHILKWGGFWGGLALTFILLAIHLSLSFFPETFRYDIPAEIIRHFGMVIHILYVFVIYGEIFNTVVGNIFGVSRQLKTVFGLSFRTNVWIILFVIFIISQAGYGMLLSVLYPLFGYMGLLFLFFLLFKKTPGR